MELCTTSLHMLHLKKKHLPIDAVREFMIQVLEGLRYLHRNGIAHLDIKPENLLLSTGGVVKVVF